jgi:(1->4)-alpha-D-glucan 1-alpha-D-glucosylmutase
MGAGNETVMSDLHTVSRAKRATGPRDEVIEDGGVPVRVPRATYRLQLNKDFTFAKATALVPYLAELGVSHVYCSPYLRARSGSNHGYDIIDHNALNPEIGSKAQFDAFVRALHAHGMSHVIDVVPNHMGVLGADNAWWLDVLENGRASRFAEYFDIDWQPASADLADRVLVPVLGEHYGTALEKGELKLSFDPAAESFNIHYHNHRFPIDPREYPQILDVASDALGSTNTEGPSGAGVGPGRRKKNESRERLEALSAAFAALPPRTPERRGERGPMQALCKQQLAQLVAERDDIREALDRALERINGRPGDTQSFDRLHKLLEAQVYRLAYWRVASDEINYRRFFDVNELAALRTELPAVFEATHRLVVGLVQQGAADALRIDHPDGLFDPADYFDRLQAQFRPARSDGDRSRPLYIVAEKIIAPFENMPESWPVYGTTGYRFANVANGLYVDTRAAEKFTRIYESFVRDRSSFDEIAQRSKRLVLRTTLASDLTVLANRLFAIARAQRATRDYSLYMLRQALADVVAAFPVYRTYVSDEVSAEDRRYIEWAVASARRHTRAADESIFDFIKCALLAEPSPPAPQLAPQVRLFARKFQQLTAPVMAKGVEDTSFYIYNRLLSLNEVGGDPGTFGYGVNAFHGASADRAHKWPHTMLSTSTHDNKRSEDVRCRIDVLSEMPATWRLQLRRWSRMNRSRKSTIDDEQAPSRNDEYLIYQTLLGSFPVGATTAQELAAYRERIEQYVLKAIREAKVHTSWLNPNQGYENAATGFVHALLSDSNGNLFLEDLRESARPLAWFGMLNSLSLTLVKFTSPGVPDIYQGNEMLDFSLVDPDNRRPVDYARRRAALSHIVRGCASGNALETVRQLFMHPDDGRAKLYLVWRLLQLRRELSELFLGASYTALKAEGLRAAHVVAYARRYRGRGVITLAGRLFTQMGVAPRALPCGPEVWGDTRVEVPFLEEGSALRDVLSGRRLNVRDGALDVGQAWESLPGAVLVYEGGEKAS